MNVALTLTRFLPGGLRARGRDWFETRFRGTPPAMLNCRAFTLPLDLDVVLSHYRVQHPEVRYLQVGPDAEGLMRKFCASSIFHRASPQSFVLNTSTSRSQSTKTQSACWFARDIRYLRQAATRWPTV